jgi:transglutaminase-like putative cysteine protease
MRAQIAHTTVYTYPEDAWDSHNQIRLQPCEDERQTVLASSLEVSIVTATGLEQRILTSSHLDYYGTTVHQAHALEAHRTLRIQAISSVMTQAAPVLESVSVQSLEPFLERWNEFLESTHRVDLAHDWLALLECYTPQAGYDLVTYLLDLNRHLHSRFVYSPGSTTVSTPLEEFVQSGHGVCQDYAHAMLAVCRRVRLPARYVSGYIDAGADYVGAAATHAWVECLIPGVGWVGFDPTNAILASEAHVKIGHGRDYDDVPPIRGVRRGGGRETLGVNVSVESEQ